MSFEKSRRRGWRCAADTCYTADTLGNLMYISITLNFWIFSITRDFSASRCVSYRTMSQFALGIILTLTHIYIFFCLPFEFIISGCEIYTGAFFVILLLGIIFCVNHLVHIGLEEREGNKSLNLMRESVYKVTEINDTYIYRKVQASYIATAISARFTALSRALFGARHRSCHFAMTLCILLYLYSPH